MGLRSLPEKRQRPTSPIEASRKAARKDVTFPSFKDVRNTPVGLQGSTSTTSSRGSSVSRGHASDGQCDHPRSTRTCSTDGQKPARHVQSNGHSEPRPSDMIQRHTQDLVNFAVAAVLNNFATQRAESAATECQTLQSKFADFPAFGEMKRNAKTNAERELQEAESKLSTFRKAYNTSLEQVLGFTGSPSPQANAVGTSNQTQRRLDDLEKKVQMMQTSHDHGNSATLQSETKRHDVSVAKHESELESHARNIARLKQDGRKEEQAKLAKELAESRKEQAKLREEQVGLKEKQADLGKELSELKSEQVGFYKEQVKLKKEQTDAQDKLQRWERNNDAFVPKLTELKTRLDQVDVKVANNHQDLLTKTNEQKTELQVLKAVVKQPPNVSSTARTSLEHDELESVKTSIKTIQDRVFGTEDPNSQQTIFEMYVLPPNPMAKVHTNSRPIQDGLAFSPSRGF